MGLSKTGTTSLQQSLHSVADSLLDREVLYPKFHERHISHHLLVALCGNPKTLHPWLLHKFGGPDGAIKAARQAWNQTCKDIERIRPKLLVLSSEYLVHHTTADQKARIAALLAGLSDDVVPVLYVRHPVDHYRSRLQQCLKTTGRPFPPQERDLKKAILDTEAAFGRPPELVVFDRKELHSGDVVADFAARFLAPWVQPEDLPAVESNVGLSAEALVLLAKLRNEAGGTMDAARRVAGLNHRLAELDSADPPAGPLAVLPEVAEYALRTAISHRWLAETGRLHIPGLDISKIDGAPVPEWMNIAPPETLVLHDPARVDRLRAALERSGSLRFLKAPKEKRSKSRTSRIGDFVLRFVRQKLASIKDRKTGAAPTRGKAPGRSSQGDNNEDHETAGNLDAGARNRP